MKSHIIYHAGCPDGFGAAYMVSRCWQIHGIPDDDIVLHPMSHGDDPPDIDEDDVLWMVDFANVPSDWMVRQFDVRPEMVVLDHHRTAWQLYNDTWGALHGKSQHPLFFTAQLEPAHFERRKLFALDMDHSGVGLAAMYAQYLDINPGEILPFWPNLEDRDLWRFELYNTANVFAAVTSRPFTVQAWHEMVEMSTAELAREGEAINRYRDQLIEDAVSKRFWLFIDNYKIPCAASPYAIGSDVAGWLAEESEQGIGAYAIYVGNEVQIGLRSRGDDAPDVAEIAERRDGGGHRNASGFRMHADLFGILTAAV